MKSNRLDSLYLFLACVCVIVAFTSGIETIRLRAAIHHQQQRDDAGDSALAMADPIFGPGPEQQIEEKIEQQKKDYPNAFIIFGISTGLFFVFWKLQHRYERWR